MAGFPSSFIEQLRDATDIVALVSEYLPLKQAGKNFKGLCPFHNEKTPSFNVSPEKQIFHCFGCGQGGDAFKFLMLYDKMSFTEAITHLASRAGMALPNRARGSRGGRDDRDRTEMMELHAEASRFYQGNLRQEASGKRGIAYLERRGFTREAIDRVGFGLAPDRWTSLLEHLTRRGARPELVARAGLAVPRRQGGGFYDRFRNRLMIPIQNESGDIVAFGGRLLGQGEPKYLNSPESPIYNKSRLLYGFHHAKTAIRQQGSVILMEGYFDCIQAYQGGIDHAVACCGTSLTAGHARLLRRYTDRVVVNFDPDDAGQTATRRSIDLLIEEGFQVAVLQLPPGSDPDDFILENGPEAYRAKLGAAPSFVDYLIDGATRRHDVRSPRGKVDFLNAVLPTLARIPNQVERVGYVSRLAERAEIADATVVEELRRQVTARAHRVELSSPPSDSIKPAERDLIRWLLQTPGEAGQLLGEVQEEDLRGLATASILRAMKDVAASGSLSTDRVLDRLTAEGQRNLFTRIALEPSPLGPRQTARDCLNRLREQRWRRELSRLRAKVAQGEVDDEITAQIQALARRIESSGRIETTT